MKVHDINSEVIEEIINLSNEESLIYFEYDFIPETILRNNLRSSLSLSIEKKDTISKALYKGNNLLGYFVLEKIDFDSEIFGYNVYRITAIDFFTNDNLILVNLFKATISTIEQCEVTFKIKYLILSINSNISKSSFLLTSFLQHRFYFINTLLTFSLIKNEIRDSFIQPGEFVNDLIIRSAQQKDAAEIIDIACNSHRINRFYLDPNLDRKKCDRLHATSARNSIINGFADIIFVAEYQDHIIGYYSGRKKTLPESELVIGEAIISAVNEKFRGKGVFNLLDDALLKWFNTQTNFAEMGTYINNYPVHRTWIKKELDLIRSSYQLAKFNSKI